MLCPAYGKEQLLAVGLGWDAGARGVCSAAFTQSFPVICISVSSLLSGCGRGVPAGRARGCSPSNQCPGTSAWGCQPVQGAFLGTMPAHAGLETTW